MSNVKSLETDFTYTASNKQTYGSLIWIHLFIKEIVNILYIARTFQGSFTE